MISYELVGAQARRCAEIAKRFEPRKHVVVNAALSDEAGTAGVGGSGEGATMKRGEAGVTMTTLDLEEMWLNMTVGFLKADVEGAALRILRGARKMIERDHPILSLAVYHTFEELTGIPAFVERIGGYRIELRQLNPNRSKNLGGLTMIVIPERLTLTPRDV